MKRLLMSFIVFFSILSVILLLMCRELPSDPSEDPNNVNVSLSVQNLASGIFQGQSVTLRMIVRYPDLTKSVLLSFDEIIPDTTVFFKTGSGALYDTLDIVRVFSSAGPKKVEAYVALTNNSFKLSDCPFTVVPKLLTVAFDSVPVNQKTATNYPDTLVFTARTDPAGASIVFMSSVSPLFDTVSFKSVVNGSKFSLILIPPKDTAYLVTVIAQSGTSLDTAYVQVISTARPVVHEVSSVTTVQSGRSDTLVFTVRRNESDTVNMLTLLNAGAFKAGEITATAAGKDSLGFIFTPSVAGIDTFYIESKINNLKDTLCYTVSVVKATFKPWIQDTLTVRTKEGALLDLSLVSFLNDTSLLNTKLLTDKGVITGKSLGYTVPYGSSARDSITVTVAGMTDSSKIRIYLDISMSDSLKPLITRNIPSDSVFTTGSPVFICKFKITDSGAGVGDVAFIIGTTLLTDVSHTDSIYQCTVNNLVHGQKTSVKIKATDKSINKNSDYLIVYLTYDSTMSDTVDPVIVFVNPSADSSRFSSSSLNIEVSCTDNNGIKNVSCLHGTTAVVVAKGVGNSYIASISGLSAGSNTLVFTATDGSLNANAASKIMTVIFDPTMEDNVVPVVKLKNPIVNGGTLFRDSITVQIECKDDNRIASVVCSRAGVPVSVTKSADSIYSVFMTGLTAGLSDTLLFTVTDSSAKSNKNTFPVIVKYTRFKVAYLENGSTAGAVPADTIFYESGAKTTVAGNTGLLVKTGSKFTGWNTFANGTGIAYSPGSELKIDTANVNLYAQWSLNPTYSVTYYGNGSNGGTVPEDANMYESGETVTAKANSGGLIMTGYQFNGWTTNANGTGAYYPSGNDFVMGVANISLFAAWNITSYSITYNLNGGTDNAANQSTYTIQTPTVTLSSPARAGYSFGGWYTLADFSGTPVTSIAKGTIGNINLFAKWTLILPVIITQPSGLTADIGDTIKFTVAANSIAGTTLLFQWQKNGNNIAGATGSLLILNGLVKSDSGSIYRCVVSTSAGGSTASSVAALQVLSVKSIEAGVYHSMIIKTDGTLWACGDNRYGQLGNSSSGDSVAIPIKVMANVAAVSAGNGFTMFLKNDGTLWSVGINNYGQLGDGTTVNRPVPKQIMTGVASVSTGGYHTMIIRTDGSLWATGYNFYGQLGATLTDTVTTPKRILTTGVAAVSACGWHSMILKTDGSLWATGRNTSGQLGDSTKTNRSTLVNIMAKVKTVSTGNSHTIILKTDGTMWAAGANDGGQLGDNTDSCRLIPVKILSGVTGISAGTYHSMIINSNSSLMGTGYNSYGQLGDNTTTSKNVPVNILTGGVSNVSAGGYHTLILKTDGSVWATGQNIFGQLGDNTKVNKSVPVRVRYKY